ncbi:TIGR02300 family protein [Propylenella binzhouense]|uniref:TIGR02300 family protein n=1 Tax=Propylenella binzhouense TaxID=2555902 RepID=A0A964WU18_9HYPH|nr:TIGR02300 family protein [Propylenella binzhouense]
MAKPELGTKRACPACGTKYYDLNRDPIVCPNCGTIFELTAREKASPARAADEDTESNTEEELDEQEADVEIVSLEDAEEDVVDDDEDDDETGPRTPDVPRLPDEDIDIDEDVGVDEGEDGAFLDEDEEGGDDVSDFLEVEDDDEDER